MNDNTDELRRMVRDMIASELKKRVKRDKDDESDTSNAEKPSIKDPLRNMKAIKKYYGQSNRLD